MSSKDSALYNQRSSKLSGGKEISSSTTLSFTSQLSSLINNSKSAPAARPNKPKRRDKDDIFTVHNRNTAKRAKRDLDTSSDSAAHFEQKHTTDGEVLDKGIWERSKRKMEQKARLYAAMKRGDVEDVDERYAVDFDKKWAEKHATEGDSSSSDSDSEVHTEMVEYLDEFGRLRTGTKAEAARANRIQHSRDTLASDRFTARPSAPSRVIHGDAIQHQAFDPDAPIAAQMEELAKKRDRSLTPPPEEHFDATKEVRSKGTGFFQFSGDAEERRKQMEGLEEERLETERRRREREEKVSERKRVIEERRKDIAERRGKRKADAFLEELGEELGMGRVEKRYEEGSATDAMQRIEAAVEKEDER